jgi:hypothetical protein
MDILDCDVSRLVWGIVGLYCKSADAFQSISPQPVSDVRRYMKYAEEARANNIRYLSCLTFAPVFFAAAIYLCLSRIIVIYGPEYSRFRPRTYTILFMSCDFVSLVLQAAGGVITDTNLTNLPMQMTGVHVMVGGLAFQVASLLLFATLCIEYAWRVKTQKGTRMTEYIHISKRRQFHFFLYCKSRPSTLRCRDSANLAQPLLLQQFA